MPDQMYIKNPSHFFIIRLKVMQKWQSCKKLIRNIDSQWRNLGAEWINLCTYAIYNFCILVQSKIRPKREQIDNSKVNSVGQELSHLDTADVVRVFGLQVFHQLCHRQL